MDHVRAAAGPQGIEINADAFRSAPPIIAISSVYGMNLIVSDSTRPMHLFLVVVVMAVVSGLILRWTRRSGWW